MPATPWFDTPKLIALQNCNSNGVRDHPIMLVGLAVFLKNINAYGQIVAATILSDDRPSLFCPQFADSSSPFFLVLRSSYIVTFFHLGIKVPPGHFQTGVELQPQLRLSGLRMH